MRLLTMATSRWRFVFLFLFAFIHMCIQCLGHFSPPSPGPLPYLPGWRFVMPVFVFFFLVLTLKFDLRDLHLLGKHSTS
jgi:hypothetical protein